MKNKEQSIFQKIYRPVFLSISALLLLIIIILVSIFSYFLINNEMEEIDNGLRDLSIISRQTETEIKIAVRILTQLNLSFENRFMQKYLENMMSAVLIASPQVYGMGYARNPEYEDYGIYLYEDSNQFPVKKIYLESVYKKLGTAYYQRPWFIRVTNTKKIAVYTPQINWFNKKRGYTMTYAYPFLGKDNEVLAVGVMDIDVRDFLSLLGQYNSYYTYKIYFEIGNYPGAITKHGYYYFDNKDRTPNYRYNLNFVKNIGEHWTMRGASLYKRVSYVYGGLNFLIKINLAPFVLIVGGSIVMLLFIYTILILFVRNKLREKINIITFPITIVSNYLSHMIDEKQFDKQLYKKSIYPKEVDQLFNSYEKLRKDLIHYLGVEKDLTLKKTQLDLAKKIQNAFVSHHIDYKNIRKHGFDVSVYYKAGGDLSGDVFDVLLENKYLYFFICDTSGKDAAASIFGLFVLSQFKVLASRSLEPTEILHHLNNYLYSFNYENMFMTAICIRIEIDKNEILLANAGHNAPIFNPLIKEVLLPEGDLVLGLIENITYGQRYFNRKTIEWVLLYTDGLSEASQNSVPFGVEKITNTILESHETEATGMLVHLSEAVERYEEASLTHDDKTAILICFF